MTISWCIRMLPRAFIVFILRSFINMKCEILADTTQLSIYSSVFDLCHSRVVISLSGHAKNSHFVFTTLEVCLTVGWEQSLWHYMHANISPGCSSESFPLFLCYPDTAAFATQAENTKWIPAVWMRNCVYPDRQVLRNTSDMVYTSHCVSFESASP